MSEAMNMIYDTLALISGSVIKENLTTVKVMCAKCDKWYKGDECPNCGSNQIFGQETGYNTNDL